MPLLIEKRDRLQQQAEALAQIYRVVRLAKPFTPQSPSKESVKNTLCKPKYKRDFASSKNLIASGYGLIFIIGK